MSGGSWELKPLSREAIPGALEKAHRYRLLNEPVEAESICRDILDVDAHNQDALVTLLLALTDQFEENLGPAAAAARTVLSRITDDYSRLYHTGIACERRAKAHLKRGGPHSRHLAYEWFQRALENYDQAAAQRPAGNDDAILRWNTCVRILRAQPELVPNIESEPQPWLE
jgi:hypothetical protein